MISVDIVATSREVIVAPVMVSIPIYRDSDVPNVIRFNRLEYKTGLNVVSEDDKDDTVPRTSSEPSKPDLAVRVQIWKWLSLIYLPHSFTPFSVVRLPGKHDEMVFHLLASEIL